MTLLKYHQDYIDAGNFYTKVNISDTEYFIILGTKVQDKCKAKSYVGENHLGETKIMSLENYRLSLDEGKGVVYDVADIIIPLDLYNNARLTLDIYIDNSIYSVHPLDSSTSVSNTTNSCYAIDQQVSDDWCTKNCNNNPSNCPAKLCTCTAPTHITKVKDKTNSNGIIFDTGSNILLLLRDNFYKDSKLLYKYKLVQKGTIPEWGTIGELITGPIYIKKEDNTYLKLSDVKIWLYNSNSSISDGLIGASIGTLNSKYNLLHNIIQQKKYLYYSLINIASTKPILKLTNTRLVNSKTFKTSISDASHIFLYNNINVQFETLNSTDTGKYKYSINNLKGLIDTGSELTYIITNKGTTPNIIYTDDCCKNKLDIIYSTGWDTSICIPNMDTNTTFIIPGFSKPQSLVINNSQWLNIVPNSSAKGVAYGDNIGYINLGITFNINYDTLFDISNQTIDIIKK